MDDIKVAFETIIVGVLAAPWLAILFFALSTLFDRYTRENPLKALIQQARGEKGPDERVAKLSGVFLVAAAYFVGAGISRVADDFTGISDGSRFLYPMLKSDGCIRMQTYLTRYRSEHVLQLSGALPPRLDFAVARFYASPLNLSCLGDAADTLKKLAVKPIYTYEKFRVYNSSPNGFETLRHIESEIVVLRGGFLNGLILCLLCLPYLVTAMLLRLAAAARNRTERRNWRPNTPTTHFIAVFTLGFTMALMGRVAWQAVEKQYDDRLISLYSTLSNP